MPSRWPQPSAAADTVESGVIAVPATASAATKVFSDLALIFCFIFVLRSRCSRIPRARRP
ncbi:MAG: hypothetical protein CL534_07500 [Ahrensia sp.]|nr:hypothetical protein [Ahrensia sp.]